METTDRKMSILAVGVIILVLGFLSSEAFPWGYATHTYIEDHLGKTKRNRNMNEIYGGVAPDIFNYLFNTPEYQSTCLTRPM